MTICDGMEERLNDYVDEVLSAAERREVERHVGDCAGCREELHALRAVVEATAALPRSPRPPRDLWPDIRAALRRDETQPRLVFWWPWGAGLAAAAALLVLTTAAVTMWLVGSGAEGPGPGMPETPVAVTSAPATALASLRSAEGEYVLATDRLLEVLEARREELAPETLALVEENLRVIDDAIGNVWAALESDPGRARSGHLLTSLYWRKIALLQQAVRLPEQTKSRSRLELGAGTQEELT
jgi:anti-sigma factor RsiW